MVLLETHQASISNCTIDASGTVSSQKEQDWDPSTHLMDRDGKRLLEEVSRRVRSCWEKKAGSTEGVVVTMPGTLGGFDTVVSSSRLGIRDPVPISDVLSGTLGVPCLAFHDVECLALGEDLNERQRGDRAITADTTLVYVFADEGVGSKAIIDGRAHVGAGAAGTVGRLTVQPEGSYFKALTSRGPLEVYSSRPWVSENLVTHYLSEQDKRGSISDQTDETRFRRSLRVAADGDWRSIDYELIAAGITDQDPIVLSVLDVAARYLGLAIHSIITILHPHQIVLGGAMMTQLPGFSNQVIAYARRFSWPLAWNRTGVRVSSLGRQAQIDGAVELWRRQRDGALTGGTGP